MELSGTSIRIDVEHDNPPAPPGQAGRAECTLGAFGMHWGTIERDDIGGVWFRYPLRHAPAPPARSGSAT
jgi:hypothetical protein